MEGLICVPTGPSISRINLQSDVPPHVSTFERVPGNVNLVWIHGPTDVDLERTAFQWPFVPGNIQQVGTRFCGCVRTPVLLGTRGVDSDRNLFVYPSESDPGFS